MLVSQFLVAGLVAVASATTLVAEESFFSSLLKRQEPGSPAYDCHSACGSKISPLFMLASRLTPSSGAAITLSRGADPCNNATFVTNYNSCLKCAGPGNVNIWRYYGGTLSTAGAKCGLETEPAAGGNESAASSSSSSATPVASSSRSSVLASASSAATSMPVTLASTTVVSTTAQSSSVSRTPTSRPNVTTSVTTVSLGFST